MASEDTAPGEDNPRLPVSRRHLFEEEIAWDFEDDVADLVFLA